MSLYTASAGEQVACVKGPGDSRPVVSDTLGPAWGFHGADVNLALGNLVFGRHPARGGTWSLTQPVQP